MSVKNGKKDKSSKDFARGCGDEKCCPSYDYYRNNKHEFHRLDGPAVIYSSGVQEWWQNNALHNFHGPSIIDKNRLQYWIAGERYSKNKFLAFPSWKMNELKGWF